MRNLRIACNADNVGNIPLGKFNLKLKKWRQVLKFCLPSAILYPWEPVQPYHFQVDLIWCDGNFNNTVCKIGFINQRLEVRKYRSQHQNMGSLPVRWFDKFSLILTKLPVVEFVNVFLSIFLATVSYLQLLHQYIDLLLKKYIYLKGTRTQEFYFILFHEPNYPSAKIVTLKWFLTKNGEKLR